MQKAHHDVDTRQGSIALRLPMPQNKQWPADRATIHANPGYALWYGWSEMQRDLTKIRTLAADLREKQAAKK